MAPVLLFTGFPGSLARELVPRVLAGASEATAICLVRPESMRAARRLSEELDLADRSLRGRLRLVAGDVTRPDLGIEAEAPLLAAVTEVFHLAGVSHPGVREEVARRVNVEGTRHVLAFAERCGALARFHHLGTCFVSGRFAGLFSEEDLDRGQSFHNAWEESRFLAEAEVRHRMTAGLPATVYRVAAVVGDAATGETAGYGGPYWLIRWVLRLPRVAVVPRPGDSRGRPNLVPRDFVTGAIAHLSGLPQSRGRTYHLADPSPPSLPELLDALGRAAGRRILSPRLPARAVRSGLSRLPGAAALAGVPPEAADYLDHPGYYGTENARADLEAAGLRVPPPASYLDRVVDFFRRHPEIGWERPE